ncbi:hypothetical protein GO986_20835 [Deinococcus sp. HMF7620]|uniref:O-antigen ligase-related domain-containing protein n=1 Tax=Deinococcus arboris TaxID=2682977 RepID=A0A7C9IF60_9DEIO|nr:O-antigen ligase family protein [Deinococcus arboris]MVN89186.1 hypothetical protein [Deinococcus arboris]
MHNNRRTAQMKAQITGALIVVALSLTPLIFSFTENLALQPHTPKYKFLFVIMTLITILNFDNFIQNIKRFWPILLALIAVVIHQASLTESGFNFIGPVGQEAGLITYAFAVFSLLSFNGLSMRPAYLVAFATGTFLATFIIFLQQLNYNIFDYIYGDLGSPGTIGNRGWLIPMVIASLVLGSKNFTLNTGRVLFAIGVFSLCVSLNKTVLFTSSLILLIYIFIDRKDIAKVKSWLSILVVFILTFVSYYNLTTRFNLEQQNIVTTSEKTGLARADIYKVGWDVFLRSPLIGSGFGSFYGHWYDWGKREDILHIACTTLEWNCEKDVIRKYGKIFVNENRLEIQSIDIWHPHNEILHLLIAGGLSYILLFCFLIYIYRVEIKMLLNNRILLFGFLLILAYCLTWTFQISTMIPPLIILILYIGKIEKKPVLDS